MKDKSSSSTNISIRSLAEGWCKSITNAKRLIEDGKVLLQNERYIGAINSFRLAVEEISKAHLLNQPVSYNANEINKWKWFWKAFRNHKEKLKIIEYEFSSRSIEELIDFDARIQLLISTREDSIYVKYDSQAKRFLSPEESLGLAGNPRDLAVLEIKYISSLFNFFAPEGIPTIDQIERVFQMQHDGRLK